MHIDSEIVKRSIKKRLFYKIGYPIFAILLVSSCLLISVSLYYLKNETDARSTMEVKNLANNLGNFLIKLSSDIVHVSKNPQLVNSLLNKPSKNLLLFLDANKKWLYGLNFYIVDSEINLVYPQLKEEIFPKNRSLLRQISYTGINSYFFNSSNQKLSFGTPIIYYGTPQGVLIVDIDLDKVIVDLLGQSSNYFIKISSSSEEIYSNIGNSSLELELLGSKTLDDIDKMLNSLKIDLYYKTTPFLDLFELLIILFIGIMAIVILALYSTLNSVSKTITSPIMNFVSIIKRNNADEKCFPLGTDDELEILAKSYDEKSEDHRKLTNNLESIVQERTNEFKAAHKKAENALKARSMFIANMSHEIRTPLNGILGMTEIISDTANSQDVLENLKIISTSGNILLSIINDILDFTKMENNNLSIENIPFDLYSLIESNIGLMSSNANEKGIILDCEIENGTPKYISSDPTRLSQVILNLVGNAIKFTSRGGVFFSIYYCKFEKMHIIKVRDTGIGINEGDIKTLFEPFSQADDSITRKFGGTGLGLSISKKLIDILGGEITIESKIGIGTTFTIKMEFQLAKECDVEIKKSSKNKNLNLNKLKILVVEDNQINQIIIQNYLKLISLNCDIANNGAEAVKMVLKGNTSYDLIFMDLQMPVMGGLEASAIINKNYIGNTPPKIIALTANAMSEHRKQCEDVGMSGFLSKPIVKVELHKIIQSFDTSSKDISDDTMDEKNKNIYSGELTDSFEVVDKEIDSFIVGELFSDFEKEEVEGYFNKLLQDCGDLIKSIKNDIENKNMKEIRFKAHSINGNVSNFGLLKIQSVAVKLEKVESIDDANKYYKELEDLIKNLNFSVFQKAG